MEMERLFEPALHIYQRWRHSVRGRFLAWQEHHGAVTAPNMMRRVAQIAFFECWWCAQNADAMFSRRGNATATLYCCRHDGHLHNESAVDARTSTHCRELRD